jgi:hypothetical protein
MTVAHTVWIVLGVWIVLATIAAFAWCRIAGGTSDRL